ncbi:UDP-3-O-acyl-N-acetylglucosamine deacetylase [Paracoccaceae bacterium]|nr:UDP-3-O-acyl-N-acetylglucosamine deacetylase [Paracoccaceae bacterium]
MFQKSIKKSFALEGRGLHFGKDVSIVVHPAPADHGIVFKRTDIDHNHAFIKASFENVSKTYLRTQLTNSFGVSIITAEHILAAFAGLGIHNAFIELGEAEVPIFDGSSRTFVKAILETGVSELTKKIKLYQVVNSIRVGNSDAWAELRPAEKFSIDFEMDWPGTALGKQNLDMPIVNGTFVREICDSRTFCRKSDVVRLKDEGFALGGGIENAILVGEHEMTANNGLRYADECVRHKILDALGDLSLVGRPILGKFVSCSGGHGLTNILLRESFKRGDVFVTKEFSDGDRDKLPGFDISNIDIQNIL